MARTSLRGLILGGKVIVWLSLTVMLSFTRLTQTPKANVNDLVNTGTWRLPILNSRHRHNHSLRGWIHGFDYPAFDLLAIDSILWAGTPIYKINTRRIWDAIRFKLLEIPWHHLVWHKLKINRYVHHQWLVCHGRLSTFQRLASLGLDVLQYCILCVGVLNALIISWLSAVIVLTF